MSCQHYHRYGLKFRVCLEFLQYLKSVHVRHIYVENDKIGIGKQAEAFGLFKVLQKFDAVFSLGDPAFLL